MPVDALVVLVSFIHTRSQQEASGRDGELYQRNGLSISILPVSCEVCKKFRMGSIFCTESFPLLTYKSFSIKQFNLTETVAVRRASLSTCVLQRPYDTMGNIFQRSQKMNVFSNAFAIYWLSFSCRSNKRSLAHRTQ